MSRELSGIIKQRAGRKKWRWFGPSSPTRSRSSWTGFARRWACPSWIKPSSWCLRKSQCRSLLPSSGIGCSWVRHKHSTFLWTIVQCWAYPRQWRKCIVSTRMMTVSFMSHTHLRKCLALEHLGARSASDVLTATTLPRGYAVPRTNFSWSLDDWCCKCCSVAVRSKPSNGGRCLGLELLLGMATWTV